EGALKPVSLRTNCRDAARISSSVAGGSKLNRVLMLRHMAAGLRAGGEIAITPQKMRRSRRRARTEEAAATPRALASARPIRHIPARRSAADGRLANLVRAGRQQPQRITLRVVVRSPPASAWRLRRGRPIFSNPDFAGTDRSR